MSTARQARRFLVVGTTTVGIDLASYSLCLALGLAIDPAKGIGFVTGTIFAYLANRHWTFSPEGGLARMAVFALLYLSTLAINVGANAAIIWALGGGRVSLGAAFLVATGLSATLNFLGMKFLVFRT